MGDAPQFDKALAAAKRGVALEPTNPYRKAAMVSTLLVGGQDVDPRHAAHAVAVAEDAFSQAPNLPSVLVRAGVEGCGPYCRRG